MTDKIIEREFVISQALIALHNAIPNSRIEYESDSPMATPYCTVDGKRQVVSIEKHPGYDLWVPKRKPYLSKTLIDDMTCNDFGVSLQQAIAFLQGVPMNAVRNMNKKTIEQKQTKSIFKAMSSVLVDIAQRDPRNMDVVKDQH